MGLRWDACWSKACVHRFFLLLVLALPAAWSSEGGKGSAAHAHAAAAALHMGRFGPNKPDDHLARDLQAVALSVTDGAGGGSSKRLHAVGNQPHAASGTGGLQDAMQAAPDRMRLHADRSHGASSGGSSDGSSLRCMRLVLMTVASVLHVAQLQALVRVLLCMYVIMQQK